jgi:hypothetical protein
MFSFIIITPLKMQRENKRWENKKVDSEEK